jgi:hypothetical protein
VTWDNLTKRILLTDDLEEKNVYKLFHKFLSKDTVEREIELLDKAKNKDHKKDEEGSHSSSCESNDTRLLEDLSDEEGWSLRETEEFVIGKVKATKVSFF